MGYALFEHVQIKAVVCMARNQANMDGVRKRILAASKELFVQQGYRKTTIRQIVEKSGVLTGSIYYFFRNKEDIFQALILSLMKQCIFLINKNFKDEQPLFKYAAMCMVEFKAVEINELARESYYEGYTSKVIFEKMVEHATDLSIRLFKDSGMPFDRTDYYMRNIFIKGSMRSYIAQFYFTSHSEPEKYIPLFLTMTLKIFDCGDDEINQVLHQLKNEEGTILKIAETLIKNSITF